LDLVFYVRNITDSKTVWSLKRNAKLLCELTETKARTCVIHLVIA